MPVESVSTLDPAPKVRKRAASDQNAAVVASFLGWTLDAFDYFLVIYCLTAMLIFSTNIVRKYSNYSKSSCRDR